jgi:hypothetical protein
MFTDHISMFLCPSLSLMSVAKATQKPLKNVGFIWQTFRFLMPIRMWKTGGGDFGRTSNTSQSSNRCLPYRHGIGSWHTIPLDVELQAYRKS